MAFLRQLADGRSVPFLRNVQSSAVISAVLHFHERALSRHRFERNGD
ncbi:hypothetical protein V8J36_15730 [Frigidibacter sp. MR17.14]